MPALRANTSRRPKRSRVASTRWSHSPQWPTSHTTASRVAARRGRHLLCCGFAHVELRGRDDHIGAGLGEGLHRSPRPMPRLPPVTTATLPVRSNISCTLMRSSLGSGAACDPGRRGPWPWPWLWWWCCYVHLLVRFMCSSPSDRILTVLQKNDGSQFDTHLVRRFVQLLRHLPRGQSRQARHRCESQSSCKSTHQTPTNRRFECCLVPTATGSSCLATSTCGKTKPAPSGLRR